jgi:hypothetical protein
LSNNQQQGKQMITSNNMSTLPTVKFQKKLTIWKHAGFGVIVEVKSDGRERVVTRTDMSTADRDRMLLAVSAAEGHAAMLDALHLVARGIATEDIIARRFVVDGVPRTLADIVNDAIEKGSM